VIDPASQRRGLLALALSLLVLGAMYQVKGNVELITGTEAGAAVDLRSRDGEQSYFENGINPFDRMTASQPPWGYPFGLALTWPEWPAVRLYFAILNAVALVFLAWWSYREPRDAPPHVRLLLMASVIAFGGSCTATEVGQVSIIVTALLAGAWLCDRAARPWLCGLLVALSLIKPTMSAPFAVVLILTRRYQSAAVAAAYGIAASIVTWFVTGANPLHMLRQMAQAAASYAGDGTTGINNILIAMGVSATGVALMPLVVAIPAMALIALSRSSLPIAFAIAAVWGRVWTYHKSYDDVMLAFLLVPLGALAFGRTRSRAAAIAFFVIGVLEWMPGRVLAMPAVQMLQLAAWPAALLLLLRLTVLSGHWHWAIPRGDAARDEPAI
jgi:hypothetical protein